jgi:hypothetical protein
LENPGRIHRGAGIPGQEVGARRPLEKRWPAKRAARFIALSSNGGEERDDLSRADMLLDEIKQKRLRPGQFRLRTLFLATLLLAVVLAVPRIAGWTYAWFFGFLYMAAFAFAPLVALGVTSLFPWLSQRNRILLAAACVGLAIVPGLVFAAWIGEAHTIPRALITFSFWYWLPQIACIWGVWYFLFRKARR